MKINVYLSGNPVHDRALRSFAVGIPEDQTVRLINGFKYEPSEVAVVFGVFKKDIPISWPRGKIIEEQKGRQTVILETGYLNRGDGPEHHYAAGLNGMNGWADFKNEDSPSDRWEKLGIELKPWKMGSNILLCGQVPWDGNVQNVDIVTWLYETAGDLKKLYPHDILYRPHPKAKKALPPKLPGCRTSIVPISEDFDDAFCTVIYNSNSGVESLINGIPVICLGEGSMTKNMASHTLNGLITDDRTQWANDLAYTQWTLEEMSAGESWKQLFH